MPGSSATGYLAVGVATFFFGSNFVPVKRYEAHDGMYYQWIMVGRPAAPGPHSLAVALACHGALPALI